MNNVSNEKRKGRNSALKEAKIFKFKDFLPESVVEALNTMREERKREDKI